MTNEDNMIVNGIIKCILSFITGFFNLMTSIFNNSPGILWGICLVFAFQTAMSHAAPSSIIDVNTQTSLTTMLSSQDPSASLILYSVDAMESKTYTFQMDEIRQEAFAKMASSCTSIPTLHELCLEHPASCQSTLLSIDNFEKAIVKNTQTLYSVKRVCELPNYPPSKEIISRCHQGLKWAPNRTKLHRRGGESPQDRGCGQRDPQQYGQPEHLRGNRQGP